MNETQPPLPQPSGATCANCGAAQTADAPYCTNCGAPLQKAPTNSTSTATKIIVSVALGFGALIFGAVGACFSFLGVGGGLNSIDALLSPFIILPGLAVLACLWGIYLVLRK